MKNHITFSMPFHALFLTAETMQAQASLSSSRHISVPGEKIMPEDNQEGEVNCEFPSGWDFASVGSVENAAFGIINVIYYKEAKSCIIPFFKDPEKDHLPDLFTVGFDCRFEPDEYCRYPVDIRDHQNQIESTIDLHPLIACVNHSGITDIGEGFHPGKEGKEEITEGYWRHVSISFDLRALKGAIKLYDKLMYDKKISICGIRLDVNQSAVKPESIRVMKANRVP